MKKLLALTLIALSFATGFTCSKQEAAEAPAETTAPPAQEEMAAPPAEEMPPMEAPPAEAPPADQ